MVWIPNQVGDDMLLGSPIKDFGDDPIPVILRARICILRPKELLILPSHAKINIDLPFAMMEMRKLRFRRTSAIIPHFGMTVGCVALMERILSTSASIPHIGNNNASVIQSDFRNPEY